MKIHPRLALFFGICCVSIFPILVKITPVADITSAFYRLAIAAALFLPIAYFSKSLKRLQFKEYLLVGLCGVLFASDITIWNKAIVLSSATQATLLTNLAPVWVGVGAYFFLKDKPKGNFWIGTCIALIGMAHVVGWEHISQLSFDRGFVLGVISSIIYAFYILISKYSLNTVNVFTFMSWSMFAAGITLFTIIQFSDTKLTGFDVNTWVSLLVQGVVCQFMGWMSITFALKQMKANRVSLSLLFSVVFTSVIAWLWIDEAIGWELIIGGAIILIGIALTFIEKSIVDEVTKKIHRTVD
jgi:drug/metabolite transporter (DMT)-like permease